MSDRSWAHLLDMPSYWWRTLETSDALGKWFLSYLLGLTVRFETSEHEVQRLFFTGFLVDLEGHLCWFSAGHVVGTISTILHDPAKNLLDFRWLDRAQFADAQTLPAHYKNPPMFSWHEEGIDFGIVLLQGLDALHLRQGGQLQVLTEQGWRNLENAHPEGYYILGFPIEWQTIEEGPGPEGKTRVNAETPLASVPIRRIPQPTPHLRGQRWDDPDAFYGQIVPFENVENPVAYQPKDILGMSGGPLFSIERDPTGRIRYRLVGIQASWHQERRIVRAEPIRRIVDQLALPWIHRVVQDGPA